MHEKDTDFGGNILQADLGLVVTRNTENVKQLWIQMLPWVLIATHKADMSSTVVDLPLYKKS